MSKAASKSVIIREETSPYRRPKEYSPGPGESGKLTAFGSDVKTNIGMGSKYITKYDQNPAVGQYNADHSFTRASTKNVYIKPVDEEGPKKSPDVTPAPGAYSNPYFNAKKSIKPDVYVNSKYKDVKNDTPSPNKYRPNDEFLSTTKRSSKGAFIRESVMAPYDVDVPPYRPNKSQISYVSNGIKTPKSQGSSRIKKTAKGSKTPKNTSSYQKTINEQSLN